MHKQVLILTVGYPGSGKTTLIDVLRKEFPGLNVINGDPFRDFLRRDIPYFSDIEYSEMTSKVKQANAIAKEYKRLVFETIFANGESVLVEGNHLEKEKRNSWFTKAKALQPECVTVLLYFKIDEGELLQRYKEREMANPEAAWIQEFNSWRRDQLEEPVAGEADVMLTFDQGNEEEIIQVLKTI